MYKKKTKNNYFYSFMKSIAKFLLYLLFRPKIYGSENIPDEGPIVIAANHISVLDPVLIASATKRNINFVIKKELQKYKITEVFFNALGCIPVYRSNINGDIKELSQKEKSDNLASYRQMLDVINNNQILGIFPEGTRLKDANQEIGNFQNGVSVFGKKALVIPCAIQGSYKLFRNNVSLHIGYPMVNPNTEEVKENILSLKRKK